VSSPAADLATARRHVIEAEARIARQATLIRDMREAGHSTELAEEFLSAMLNIAVHMRAHRDYLESKVDDR
jgi:hypothetical protein